MNKINKSIIYCCVCGRQITSNNISNEYECPLPATFMGFNQFCCWECSQTLDENGNFQEEM